jgi:hypothetical protein
MSAGVELNCQPLILEWLGTWGENSQLTAGSNSNKSTSNKNNFKQNIDSNRVLLAR